MMGSTRLSFLRLLFILASLQPAAKCVPARSASTCCGVPNHRHTPQLSAHARSDEVLPSRGEAFRPLSASQRHPQSICETRWVGLSGAVANLVSPCCV